MLDLDWNNSVIVEVLGFGVSALTGLMILTIATWFAYSILQNIAWMRRYVVRRSRYEALLRENERLRASLIDAREKNDYVRKLYRTPYAVAEDRRPNAA